MDEQRKRRPTHRRDTRRLRRQRREDLRWKRNQDTPGKDRGEREAKGEIPADDPPF